MLILGHEFSLREPITRHVVQQLQLQEGKSLHTAKSGGTGSKKKQQSIQTAQQATSFRARQRGLSRDASRRLNKSIDEFQNNLKKQISNYTNGDLTFTRLQTRASITFKETVKEIFKLGVRAAGIANATGTDHKLTANEEKWLTSYANEELGYFKKFLQQIKSNPTRRDVERRVGLYAEALKSVFEAGRVLSVGTEVVIYWVLQSRNPCPDCQVLAKNGPYHPSTLPTTPKAGQTRCRSHCYCSLRIEKVDRARSEQVRKLGKNPKAVIKKIRDQQKKKV